tara:strand:+ start:391 stop:525 length:135 start_codon:yes stop_codon:yes gene_type:complete
MIVPSKSISHVLGKSDNRDNFFLTNFIQSELVAGVGFEPTTFRL